MIDYEGAWERAEPFKQFVDSASHQREMWLGVYQRTVVPESLVDRAAAAGGPWRILVLAEDWCGDAFNTVPVIARLADRIPDVEVRILKRDENPAVMEAHLTGTARSIPVVMLLDGEFREHGWWGPRPAELQEWFQAEGRAMESKDRYREIRRFYARDRGRTTLEEIIRMMERGSRRDPAAA